MAANWKITQKLSDMLNGMQNDDVSVTSEVTIRKTGILIDVFCTGTELPATIDIDMNAGSVMVRCYSPVTEQPMIVKLDLNGTHLDW